MNFSSSKRGSGLALAGSLLALALVGVAPAAGATETLQNPECKEEAKRIDEKQLLQYEMAGEDTKSARVLFPTDVAALPSEASEDLSKLASLAKETPGSQIVVVGHADDMGSADYNEKLSGSRADSVKGFLIEKGVPETAIKEEFHGEALPIAGNDSDEGRALNRRVVVQVQPCPPAPAG